MNTETHKFLRKDFLFNLEEFQIKKIFKTKKLENLTDIEKYEINSVLIKQFSHELHEELTKFDKIEEKLEKENFQILPPIEDGLIFQDLCDLYNRKDFYLCFLSGISFLERTLGDILYLLQHQTKSRELRLIVRIFNFF